MHLEILRWDRLLSLNPAVEEVCTLSSRTSRLVLNDFFELLQELQFLYRSIRPMIRLTQQRCDFGIQNLTCIVNFCDRVRVVLNFD